MERQSVNLFYSNDYDNFGEDLSGFHLLTRGLKNPIVPKAGDCVLNGQSVSENIRGRKLTEGEMLMINEALKPFELQILSSRVIISLTSEE